MKNYITHEAVQKITPIRELKKKSNLLPNTSTHSHEALRNQVDLPIGEQYAPICPQNTEMFV